MSEHVLPSWARGWGLQPHPEGGFYAETWRSPLTLMASALPPEYDGERALASSILFLLLPGQVSAWHVVRGDELWIHQRGGPLMLGLGGDSPDGPGEVTQTVLGTDGAAGQTPQLVVPARFWQTARPAADEPVLVANLVAPGFDYRDWRLWES